MHFKKILASSQSRLCMLYIEFSYVLSSIYRHKLRDRVRISCSAEETVVETVAAIVRVTLAVGS